MEHYKSRNNDFYHFTNPHDDRSELDDDDYDYQHNYDYDNDDDDRSFDFNFHPRYINPIFSTHGVVNENDVSVEEVGDFDNQAAAAAALVFELDDRMKSLADKLQHTIDDIGTRVSRLDDGTSKIDKCVEDVKSYEEMYHGMTHRKLRRMQSILQEVQDGVLYLRDKHEIAETQLQLAKLQVSKMDKKNAAQTNPQQQQLQPSPASQLSSHIPLTPFINQLPTNRVTFPQPVSYHPAVSQSPKINAQQLGIPPNQQFWTPHESKPDHRFPHYIQSYQGVVGRQDHPFVNNPSPKAPNVSSYDTPCNSLPQLMHVESSRNYKSEFHAKYMPELSPDTHIHGGLPSSYETSYVKPVESSFHPHEESRRSNHTHIPVIQALPHALPTAVDLEEGSSSEEYGSAIPIDDIVDKVTAMGFRRDLVRACVRKLTVDGSAVDLNAVLDGMMKNKMI